MKNFAALTHAGKVRSSNEDCITAAPDIGLWLVADGVGGHSHGEVASRIACEHTEAGVRNGQSLTQSIEASHRAIIEEISQKPYAMGSQARMGTTVVALHRVDANHWEIAWVGDSRVYLFTDTLTQLTTDHSVVAELFARGVIDREQMATHPERNVITQSLGVTDQIALRVDTLRGEWLPNSCFLLCSDGLTDEVDDTTIASILGSDASPEEKAKALINAALNNGGSDNVSAIVVGPERLKLPDIESDSTRTLLGVLTVAGVLIAGAVGWLLG